MKSVKNYIILKKEVGELKIFTPEKTQRDEGHNIVLKDLKDGNVEE